MIKTAAINIKHLLLVGITIFPLLITSQVQAQTASPSPAASPSAAPSNAVTFPIPDLGNCENKGECLAFCDDPVNYNSCVEFAKQKNFYIPDKVLSADETLWKQTQTDLGCNSQESCLNLCSQPENQDKCDGFAKDEGLIGGYVQEPDNPDFIDQAKVNLGCDSAQSCSSFCDQPGNAQKCSEFAKQVGLLGGQVTQGPGGCASEGTCKSYCSDPNNFEQCKPFSPPNTPFQGPGGCTDSSSCRSHCEQNPDDCRSYSPGSNGRYVPIACPNGQFFGPGGACTSNDKTNEASSCAQGGQYWSGSSCQTTPPPGIDPKAGGAFFQSRADMGGCQTPGE
ncbi:MAG: hypothetical protein ACD_50C00012G0003, partial [uncultured bacterium]